MVFVREIAWVQCLNSKWHVLDHIFLKKAKHITSTSPTSFAELASKTRTTCTLESIDLICARTTILACYICAFINIWKKDNSIAIINLFISIDKNRMQRNGRGWIEPVNQRYIVDKMLLRIFTSYFKGSAEWKKMMGYLIKILSVMLMELDKKMCSFLVWTLTISIGTVSSTESKTLAR